MYNFYKSTLDGLRFAVESTKTGVRNGLAAIVFILPVLSSCESDDVTTEVGSASIKVLLFTKTSGFDHNTREESETMVQAIADQLGFEITVDNTGSEFDSAGNLNNYDVIFFTNTSGDMLNASQRSNVESYAAQGGNFISNHAASDAYGHSTASSVSGNGKGVWDWYAENVTGCSVRNSPNHTSSGFGATVSIQNGNTELTNGISFPWSDNEEWYYWEDGYIDSSFTELLRVSDTGSNSYDDARMTAHYWNRADGGKSFYTSMGHAKGKYSDTEFVQLLTNAFAYMLP
nr:ThuA domain-containing protein [uncultured Allomuricauda sp.]